MNSREKILTSLRSVQPEKTALPELDFPITDHSVIEQFIRMATLSGMEVFDGSKIDFLEVLRSLAQNREVQSSIKAHEKLFPVRLDETDPFKEESIPDVFVCEAHFGVAENAAVWINDKVLPSRILAFLPEELIMVLSKEMLLPTMHQAYQRIEKENYNYGLFIAGPSKTADIEQTLVTGAQGAKEVKLFLM